MAITSESMKSAINNSLGVQNQNLCATIARVYFANPNPRNWTLYKTGALVLVKDVVKNSAFFFKLLDLGSYRIVWEHELYKDINYKLEKKFFHTFPGDEYMIGFSFCDELDAANFFQKIQNRQTAVAPSRNQASASRTSGLQRSQTGTIGRKGGISKADIQFPTNFLHLSHIATSLPQSQRTKPRYRVILDYEGSFEDNELALNVGDIVNVIREAHDGRLFCESNGNQGFVMNFFLDMEKDQSVVEDCMICSDKKILFRTTFACEHSCCQDCISNHVKARLEGNNLRIQCLACKELMKLEDLQRVLPRDVFNLYEETSTIRSLSDDPKYVSCLNPKCGIGQYHEGGEDQPIVTCPKCHYKSCFIHKMPWHQGQTCQEYDDNKENQLHQNEDYIQNHTKPCPKCKKMIEKLDEKDCDKMVCICGYRFCWECLNDYDTILKEGNHEHKKSCRHYRGIEPPTEGSYFAG